MAAYRDASMRRKLTFVILCTCVLGLSLTCMAFEFYERASFRKAMVSRLTEDADTLGLATAASLAFDDAKFAEQTLGTIRSQRYVMVAVLYVDAFNQMLTGIQERDAALQGSRDQLELRVQLRTQELRKEVSERERAQQLQGIAYDVTRVLAGSNPIDVTLPKVLQLLCEGLDREVGAPAPTEVLRGVKVLVVDDNRTAYLLKPIRQSELREAIARVLGAEKPEGAIPLVTRYSLQDAREPGSSLKLLLAEDNLVNQRLAVRLLEKRGHRVVVAADGLEALAALKKESFDLIFMDVQMPEMDGMEATAAIREEEQQTGQHVVVIALTAHAMKGDREKCLAAGMDGYLSKPIRPQELDDLLKEYLKDRQTQPGVPTPVEQLK